MDWNSYKPNSARLDSLRDVMLVTRLDPMMRGEYSESRVIRSAVPELGFFNPCLYRNGIDVDSISGLMS